VKASPLVGTDAEIWLLTQALDEARDRHAALQRHHLRLETAVRAALPALPNTERRKLEVELGARWCGTCRPDAGNA
jgi:hypothetical protein